MRWGISGVPIPGPLPYAYPIERACEDANFPPLLAYSIACNETILGQLHGKWNAATIVSQDGGHGLFQLTSWVPDDWENPAANAHYAVTDWMMPDAQRWFREYELVGDNLVKCVAASFNAGFGAAAKAHEEGNVDSCTSENYGARALAIYHNLLAHGTPE